MNEETRKLIALWQKKYGTDSFERGKHDRESFELQIVETCRLTEPDLSRIEFWEPSRTASQKLAFMRYSDLYERALDLDAMTGLQDMLHILALVDSFPEQLLHGVIVAFMGVLPLGQGFAYIQRIDGVWSIGIANLPHFNYVPFIPRTRCKWRNPFDTLAPFDYVPDLKPTYGLVFARVRPQKSGPRPYPQIIFNQHDSFAMCGGL